jgi:hypothetical protein
VLLDPATLVATDDGPLPLRDVRVHDMSGQCRCGDLNPEKP